MVKIDIATNSTDLATRLGKLVALMPKEFMKAVNKTAVNIQKTAKQKYFLQGVGKKAPPHPFILTSRTGNLRRSITIKPAEATMPLEAIVGTNCEYAPVHEFGTDRIRKRAFLAPALADNTEYFENAISAVLKEIEAKL